MQLLLQQSFQLQGYIRVLAGIFAGCFHVHLIHSSLVFPLADEIRNRDHLVSQVLHSHAAQIVSSG